MKAFIKTNKLNHVNYPTMKPAEFCWCIFHFSATDCKPQISLPPPPVPPPPVHPYSGKYTRQKYIWFCRSQKVSGGGWQAVGGGGGGVWGGWRKGQPGLAFADPLTVTLILIIEKSTPARHWHWKERFVWYRRLTTIPQSWERLFKNDFGIPSCTIITIIYEKETCRK